MAHNMFRRSYIINREISPFVKFLRKVTVRHGVSPRVSSFNVQSFRTKSDNSKDINSLFQPIPFRKQENNADDINIGEELSGEVKKDDLLKLLNQFYRRPEVRRAATENGLDQKLFHQAYISFRQFCLESEMLPADLHIVFSDLLQGAGHVDNIFPYFMKHAKEIFPHLECMDELRKISDLRLPANWYSEARGLQRKIIIHAGPTNSGKTHHALECFMMAKTGVYCGPLRLLANEVFKKTNDSGTPCDLVTGEERRFANPDKSPADHVACTVEMCSVTTPYDVAVLDEIQMIKDPQRGWAWTRVLLGICAKEVHLCGEGSAIDLIKKLMLDTGDEVEVRRYKRLTKLKYLNKAVERFENVFAGDCIVCFNKNDIFYVSKQLEKLGIENAVIYGGLPPGTKLAQAEKFNDPKHPCKVLVATDAIGMGLNLCIKRVIFYSLLKPNMNQEGEKEMDFISTSQALQIAGRAGRFGTAYETGEVTTFKAKDIPLLKEIVSNEISFIEQAGLHPTADQIELFAYHLPHATLTNLIDIFTTLCQLDSDSYFMCNMDDFKFLADLIEHVKLPLRVRYVFCCAPIPKKQPFVCTMFLKCARQFSRGEALTLDWICNQLGAPFSIPKSIADLVHLESIFDVLDMYLWLSYRFPDMFPDSEHVRDVQRELDLVIQEGVANITRLLLSSVSQIPASNVDNVDNVGAKTQTKQKLLLDEDEADNSDSAEKNKLTKAFVIAKNIQNEKIKGQTSGKLAKTLVREGLITTAELEELYKEWTRKQAIEGSVESTKSSRNQKNEPKKKR
ncbi:hypothetical protein CHS0354_007239 [Potamilus streckersoni]|uniref:RNA helicase n=1 Tax=Potamilus streckersoni TaxID=2493646 RepID=A0AAE0VLB2_9BIVA|nr:hypothetical protein CHS0354_007239 [Potamilus streckersoni]